MILKERDDKGFADRARLAAAGAAAERQIAHYLRRAFADDPAVVVLNDLRVTAPDGTDDFAQVDHLLIHRYGFVVVESKSVREEVRINEHGEWCRVVNGQEKGMASPVLQSRRQADVIRKSLSAQFDPPPGRTFSRVPVAVLVAISDQGRIDRGRSDVPEVCKADAVPDRVRGLVSDAAQSGHKLFDRTARQRLADYLLSQHVPHQPSAAGSAAGAPPARSTEPIPPAVAAAPPSIEFPACRSCGSRSLHAQHGRYGYYYRCMACTANTPIAKGCPACGSQSARVRKDRLNFYKDCTACGQTRLIYVNASLVDLDTPETH